MKPFDLLARPGRNPHVDLLRGISVLIVMIGHFGACGPFKVSAVIPFEFISQVASNSYYAVVMFFVISGYLITSTSLRRYGELRHVSLKEFWLFRASRIAPPLLLLVALNLACLAIGAKGFELVPDISVSRLLANVFTLRFHILYVQGGALLAAWALLWSLTIEEIFYLGFPVTCRLLRQPRFIYPVLVAAIVLGPVYRSSVGWNALYFFRGCCGHLALGCLVAMLAPKLRVATWRPRALLLLRAAGLGGLILTASIADIHAPGALVFCPTAIAAATALFLLGSHVPTEDAARPRVLTSPLRLMGQLSYELYLFHMPVYLLLGPFMRNAAAAIGYYPKDVALLLMCTLLLFASGSLSAFVHEPILAAMRRRAQRAKPAAAN